MATVTVEAEKRSKTTFENAMKLINGVSTEKAMRMFNRNVGANVKLDKFLSGEFKLPRAFDPKTVESQIERLVNPERGRNPHQHFGLVAIEEQRAILNTLVEDKVKAEVEEKALWIQGFNLSESQQEAAAVALEAYGKTLRSAIKSVSAWKKVYGVEA